MRSLSIDDPKVTQILLNSTVFDGVAADDIQAILQCLNASITHYEKGTYIVRKGDTLSSIPIVLQGVVQVEDVDAWGNTTIYTVAQEGELVIEGWVFSQKTPVSVSVVAKQDCDILLLNADSVLTTCSDTCKFHSQILRNLVRSVGDRVIYLIERTRHVAPKTIRNKLLAYLSHQAYKNASLSFSIPLNRQQLADYLCVDRSALSAELSNMKNDGLIDVQKNQFTILAKKGRTMPDAELDFTDMLFSV